MEIFKRLTNAITLAKQEDCNTEEGAEIISSGKVLFRIFIDGEGYFKAQYANGEWLWFASNKMADFMPFNGAERFHSFDDCQQACMKAIKQQQTKLMGTITVNKFS